MNSAASRAYADVPPSCADPNSNYRLGMGDWMIGAIDALGGGFKGTSSSIIKGSHEISLVTVLKSSVQRVAVPTVAKTRPATTRGVEIECELPRSNIKIFIQRRHEKNLWDSGEPVRAGV